MEATEVARGSTGGSAPLEGEAAKTKPLVLVVDDDAALQLLARASLEQDGFAVEEATDGAAALESFSCCHPDIVLLDINLPKADGFTVCSRIRQLPGGANTPVVMMTGRDDVDAIHTAYEVGATDFITKPLHWVLLGYRLRYVLRASRVRQDLAASEAHLRAQTEKLTTLSTLTRLINSERESESVFNAVAMAAATLLHARVSQVWVDHPDSLALVLQGRFSEEAEHEPLPEEISFLPYGSGVETAVFESRTPEYVADAEQDPSWLHRELVRKQGLHAWAGVPMVASGGAVGVLALYFGAARAFSAAEKELMTLLADQAATAVENARLYEEGERGRREVETVAVLARNINASLDLNVVLQRVVEAARDLCGSDASRIALWDPESTAMILRYSVGARTVDGRPITAGHGAGGLVLLTGRPFRTDDYVRDPGISKEYVELVEREGTVALMVVPVRSETRVEGLLYVSNRSPRSFADRDEAVLLRLANHAAIAIRNAGLHAESEARRRAAETLAGVGRVLSRSLDANEVATLVVESLGEVCGAQMAALYRLEPESGDLVRMAGVGADTDWNQVMPSGTAMVGVALRERQPVATPDVLSDPRVSFTAEMRPRIEQSPFRAILAVPLTVQDRVIGALAIGDRAGRVFGDEVIRLAQSLADQAAIAIENARLFREAHSAKEEIEVLADVGRELTQTLDLEQVLGLILEQALFLAGADVAYIALMQEDGAARSVACRGEWTSALRNILVRPGSGVAGVALATGEIQESAGEVGELWEPVACEDVRAALVVPLRLASRPVGLLWLGRRSATRFSEQTKTRLQALSLWLATALDNARLYGEIALKKTELEAANTSLGETLQIQTEFLSNTPHELRTPLVSILGLLGAISSSLCTSRDEERAFVAQAHTCAEELLGLINNILDMAKISAGRIELDSRPVDLAEIFEQVRSLVQGQLATKPDLRLQFHPPAPDHGRVPADPDRLKQVLVNLVGNSLKFTDQGEVTVKALPRPEAGFMTIEVVDTGIGIPHDRQARLFQKFVQADGSTSRKHGGTGLGLAISKHLVEMMGGVIALESRGLGHGTTVTLSLPLSAPNATAWRDEGTPEPWGIQGPNETPLVLVVEDNAECRGLVRDVLHAGGFQTVEAATADEGFEMAVRLRPALVISDLALSCSESAALRNGVDLVTALARKPGLEGVPAILLTGAPAEGRALLRNVETTAPVHLLEKPLAVAEMRAAVDHALQAGYSVAVRAAARPGAPAPAREASL